MTPKGFEDWWNDPTPVNASKEAAIQIWREGMLAAAEVIVKAWPTDQAKWLAEQIREAAGDE